jgi:hypothetical protein
VAGCGADRRRAYAVLLWRWLASGIVGRADHPNPGDHAIAHAQPDRISELLTTQHCTARVVFPEIAVSALDQIPTPLTPAVTCDFASGPRWAFLAMIGVRPPEGPGRPVLLARTCVLFSRGGPAARRCPPIAQQSSVAARQVTAAPSVLVP